MKYYDISVLYHSNKANIFVDALSWLSMGSVTHVEYEKKELVRDVHKLVWLGVQLEDSPKGGFMVHNIFVSFLVVDVMSKQHIDHILMELTKSVLRKSVEDFSQGEDGYLGTKVGCVLQILMA